MQETLAENERSMHGNKTKYFPVTTCNTSSAKEAYKVLIDTRKAETEVQQIGATLLGEGEHQVGSEFDRTVLRRLKRTGSREGLVDEKKMTNRRMYMRWLCISK